MVFVPRKSNGPSIGKKPSRIIKTYIATVEPFIAATGTRADNDLHEVLRKVDKSLLSGVMATFTLSKKSLKIPKD